MKRWSTVAVIAAAVFLVACSGDSSSGNTASGDSSSGNTAEVTRSELGEEWPLTVDAVSLRCEGSAVIAEVDGTVYALNGTAKADDTLADITEIWAEDDELGVGLRKNIGVLIDRGLELC